MPNKNYWPVVMLFFISLFFCRGVLALEVGPPLPPINNQGEEWEKKAVSTASGMIHIQWRYEGTQPPDSYRIYRGEGEENPFSTEESVQGSVPWQTCFPENSCYYSDQNCFTGWNCYFCDIPEDSEEGVKRWFLVRTVVNNQESSNLDAEPVSVDLPWINSLRDPNAIHFYVEDEKRSDSFLERDEGCPFCSQSSKLYFRLAHARLAKKGENAWYYVDKDCNYPVYLDDVAYSFDNEIYTTNEAYFGRDPNNEWADIDDNGHIIILFTNLGPNIRGYFSWTDKICGPENADSIGNCADMFYISASSSSDYASLKGLKGTIAHEFQHMQHFEANQDQAGTREELWLDESCAEFAKEVNNLLDDNDSICYWYKIRPNEMSLTRFGMYDVHNRFGGCPIHWDESQENLDAIYRVLAHYDQGAIWAHYMEYNTSPVTPMFSLVEDPNTGLNSVQNHLGMNFQQAFINWTIANYTNPYADTNDTRYYYTAQFQEGAQLFEEQMVNPTYTLLPALLKNSQHSQTLTWEESSVRDLTADYILLQNNGEEQDHIHMEVSEINGQDNVCNLALVDYTNPSQAFLHQVVNLSIEDSAVGLSFFEAEKDLSCCLIISNIASYQSDDYLSSYKYRAYRTKSPSLEPEKIKLIQHGKEWLFGSELIWIRGGLMQVCLQFDQSMNQSSLFDIYLDPQGAGVGEGAVSIQPASTPWSETENPSDTWIGTILIPEDDSENWDGVAKMYISGPENFWLEPMEGSQQFDIFIDTQIPITITNPAVCFIGEIAALSWDKSLEADILGYNLYGAPGGNDPLWLPLECLSNPNFPSVSFSNLPSGIYRFFLTALDNAYNESVPSELFGLAIQIEMPLSVGRNVIGYPIWPPSGYTSEDLLSEFGPLTKSLIRYQPEESIYQISCWEGNTVQGIFPITQDEGYILYQQEAGSKEFTGPIKDGQVPLYVGKNFIGLPLMSYDETFFDAFRGLKKRRETISSVHYYQSKRGKWRGTYDFFGKISGNGTNIYQGLGCLVYSK